MSIYNLKCYGNKEYVCCGKKSLKIRNDSSKHYPNKNEASELRRIMSSTGLTEEEVRKIKKYRKQLSKAQDKDQKAKRSATEKICQNLIKSACRVTGLVPQHPETIKALQDILDRRGLKYYFGGTWLREKMTAESIVRNFAK